MLASTIPSGILDVTGRLDAAPNLNLQLECEARGVDPDNAGAVRPIWEAMKHRFPLRRVTPSSPR